MRRYFPSGLCSSRSSADFQGFVRFFRSIARHFRQPRSLLILPRQWSNAEVFLRQFVAILLPVPLDGADEPETVYTVVSEAHLKDMGFNTAWHHVDTSGTIVWKGVKRRYWDLPEYRLPIATFDM